MKELNLNNNNLDILPAKKADLKKLKIVCLVDN